MKINSALCRLTSRLHPFAPVIAATVILAFTDSSHASYPVVLHQHTGTADPTTEGWAVLSFLGATTAGPIIDSGTPAWSIVNNTPGDTGAYSVVPTPAEISTAATLGWSLQTTLRVTSPSETPGGSMLSLYRDGSRSYQMHFGSDGNGNAVVVLADNSGFDSATGARFTVPGGSVFNTFELIYSPSAGSADLFVNGVEEISNYTGFAFSQNLLAWGDGATRDLTGLEPGTNTSAGNYYENVFSIVPEPASTVLLLGSGAMLLRRRRRSLHTHERNA